MRSRGKAMRSAKMNEITPPNEIPPFHRAAASGTLPTEQTKLMMAMNGPTMAFSRLVQNPWPWRKTVFQTCTGTTTAKKSGHRVADDQLSRSMVRSDMVYVAASAHPALDRSFTDQGWRCIPSRRRPVSPGAVSLVETLPGLGDQAAPQPEAAEGGQQERS
jgi:hypothetical protein